MTTALPLSPFITDPENRFVLDEVAFMEAIEPLPIFLDAPQQECEWERHGELLRHLETMLAMPRKRSAA